MSTSHAPAEVSPHGDGTPHLRRSLSLPLLVLYGLGVTIGAGIYVLIGATAGRAGYYAPFSFVIAAVVMAFSAGSFAELAGRFPVSAGEAAYVRGAFRSNTLSVVTGLLVVFSGTVSSAAISIGGSGYLLEFVTVPEPLLVSVVVLVMGFIAAWGITQSVTFAGIFTVVELAGLVLIVGGGFGSAPAEPGASVPFHAAGLLEGPILAAVMSAGLLAFFAFIGFEDLVNLAEEAKRPERSLPWAILLTLVITTVVYVLVSYVAVHSGPLDELAASKAPLTLVFARTTELSPEMITAIAIFATLNGVIVQIVMASRVLYGLGRQGSLPGIFARVHPTTQTPLFATGFVVALVLLLALAFPLEKLAETTSFAVLTIFSLVNLALLRLKLKGEPAPPGTVVVGTWVPVCGFLTCIAFLAASSLL